MSSSDAVITSLRATLGDDETLAERLRRSLVQARRRAEADLDASLFEALEWPQDLEQYEAYLARFVRWIPQQSDAKAWQGQALHGRTAKEVSDRLAHFFFLVDQDVDENATAIMENSEEFRDWLTGFAREWGSFLDTPDSFSDEILDSFLQNSPEYTVEESLVDGRPNMPSGWRTFNQFFARELNAGLRPVVGPGTNTVVASPADCYYQQAFDIDDASNIPATRIKNQRYGNVEQLLEGSRYAATFAGGTFVHYMLPPSSYHRFHVPVSGRVEEAFVIHGKVFMQVDLADGQLQSRDAASTGYEFSQTRGVLTIDTAGSDAGDVGVIGVVPVGMSHVASVVLTATEGRPVAKGDEFGYFQFGGSDIILLFQPGIDPRLDTGDGFRHVGTSAARCRDRASSHLESRT